MQQKGFLEEEEEEKEEMEPMHPINKSSREVDDPYHGGLVRDLDLKKAITVSYEVSL